MDYLVVTLSSHLMKWLCNALLTFCFRLPDVGLIPVALAQCRQQADIQIEASAPRHFVGDVGVWRISHQAGR